MRVLSISIVVVSVVLAVVTYRSSVQPEMLDDPPVEEEPTLQAQVERLEHEAVLLVAHLQRPDLRLPAGVQREPLLSAARETLSAVDEIRSDIDPVPPGLDRIVVTGARTRTTTDRSYEVETFWVKVAFSAVFSLCALFIVLSGRFSKEKEKWAVNVLTLVGGIWIGSV